MPRGCGSRPTPRDRPDIACRPRRNGSTRARAGAMTSRHYGLAGASPGPVCLVSGNSKDRAWPVGSLLPNDLGLFDMLGNMYEWCQEPYDKTGISKYSSR